MKDERQIAQFGRTAVHRLSWPAIFGGTFFAFGIMLVLSLFGVAVGTAAGSGVGIWYGIWSLVTLFFGFYGGGWLAAKASRSQTKPEGRMHGAVVWGVGSAAVLYFLVTNTTRLAGFLGQVIGTVFTATTGPVAGITAAAATWMLIAAIGGLIGGLIGGHVGSYPAITAEQVRRAA
jgi:hypothetical protein